MVRTANLNNYSDVHFTNRKVSQAIIRYFQPSGRVLEPFRGEGAFYDYLPEGRQWCELTEGRDFFEWQEPVDWIVTNPPFSNLTDVMSHAFKVSKHTVLLVPLSKIYSSAPRLDLVRRVAGIRTQLMLGPGRRIGFDIGFPFAAIHFERGYHGPVTSVWADEVAQSLRGTGECHDPAVPVCDHQERSFN